MISVCSRTAKNVVFHKLTVIQILVCENVGVRQCSDAATFDLKQIGYNVIINLRGNTTRLTNSSNSMVGLISDPKEQGYYHVLRIVPVSSIDEIFVP